MVHGFQLMFVLPLKLVPGPSSSMLYDEGIRYTKGAFAVLMSASFSELACAIYARDMFHPRRPDESMVRSDKGVHHI